MEFFSIDCKSLLAEATYDMVTPIAVIVTPQGTIVKENPNYQEAKRKAQQRAMKKAQK